MQHCVYSVLLDQEFCACWIVAHVFAYWLYVCDGCGCVVLVLSVCGICLYVMVCYCVSNVVMLLFNVLCFMQLFV